MPSCKLLIESFAARQDGDYKKRGEELPRKLEIWLVGQACAHRIPRQHMHVRV